MKLHHKIPKIIIMVMIGALCFSMGFIFTNMLPTTIITTDTLLANYDLNEMIEYSDLIVQGNIQSISAPFWDHEIDGIIRKTVTVEVNETYLGTIDSATIKLLLTGGKIGNCIQTTSPSIEFAYGDDVILFLRKYHDNQHYLVLNSTQGALFAEPLTRLDPNVKYATSENYNFKFHSITEEKLRQAILSNGDE